MEQNGKPQDFISTLEKPPERTRWESFCIFMYNSDKGAFMGRTPLSWFKILFFYVIFYSMLACMTSGCAYIFSRHLDLTIPRWQLDESRIGTSPGMGYRPLCPQADRGFSLLKISTPLKTHEELVQQLNAFLKPYQSPLGPQYQHCDYERSPTNRSQTSCVENVSDWEPCTARHAYGYNHSAPCIFLKLNRIFGWQPDYYDDPNDLPENMPLDLKQHIQEISAKEPEKLNGAWLSCRGETMADHQNLGPVEYIPRRSFPGYFYPFLNTEGYLSPLVAVYFSRPTVGVIISVECRAWAKNIHFARFDMQGSVRFQMFVD